MKKLGEITKKILEFFLSLKDDDWVEWKATANDWQDNCDKFHECYFIVKQMPKYPQHSNCRCLLKKISKPVPNITANATCDFQKFAGYVFSDKYRDGKKEIFESWGYTIEDSAYLQKLYTAQAIEKYCNGEYEYVGTNNYSAKISIEIVLENKNGKKQLIKTIWSVGKKGEITLITPYSGHKY
ncbi:MAG: hypothetical protein IKC71_03475 [Clostridia bacterium]|nr:hypothetical protein [Clostridia bacterium]